MPAKSTNATDFVKDVLMSEKPVLVDFWAEWCPPCRAIGPTLDLIAEEHAEKLEVYKVNIDENQTLGAAFNIRSIPAMRVFVRGHVVKEFGGAMPKRDFESHLAEYLK